MQKKNSRHHSLSSWLGAERVAVARSVLWDTPTSRKDSLVVDRAGFEGGGRWKATNESRRLVGGVMGWRGGGEKATNES